MRKILTLAIFTFALIGFNNSAFGQTPQLIGYQAVVRNNSGQALPGQFVSFRFSIHNSSATGATVFTEVDTITTDPYGTASLQIGSSGNLASVNWGAGSKFLEVELDATGGSNFVNMGTSQLLSVPYTLFAAYSGSQTITGVGFRAHQGTDSVLAASAAITIPFGTADYNGGSGFSSGTGAFTAPSAGFYHFDASVHFTYAVFNTPGGNTGTNISLTSYTLETALNVDGSPVDYSTTLALPVASSVPVDVIEKLNTSIYLNAGQVVTVQAFNNSGTSSCTLSSLNGLTQFSGFKVY